ncbi:hypothetical protein ACIRJM_23090 [Streptomyces sp. NPDC102405]|uniref:hypothetical protein n=1 Tax=Streptomyces sp. NPDC102405 TaxID=3366170 RepID=UPI0038232C6F
MIADAVNAVIALGWALAAWIVLAAAVATLALYAVTVIVWTLLRPLRAVWPRRAVCAPAGASRSPTGDSRDHPEPPRPAQRHTTHPAPTWARTDKDAA